MIANSSLFQGLIKDFVDERKSNNIISAISAYEGFIDRRVKIQDINPTNYNVVLNNCIEYIQWTSLILSWINDTVFTIRKEREKYGKLLDLKTIEIVNQIEASNFLNGFATKAEKTEAKKFKLREQVIGLEQKFDDAKAAEQLALKFTKDAENLRDMVYAYYQAVKRCGGE